MEKYKTEFRLKVVKSFLAGEGGAKLRARQPSVREEKIRTCRAFWRAPQRDMKLLLFIGEKDFQAI